MLLLSACTVYAVCCTVYGVLHDIIQSISFTIYKYIVYFINMLNYIVAIDGICSYNIFVQIVLKQQSVNMLYFVP